MDNPGVSLFTGGVSLQLNVVDQQEREEEEQEQEEQRRIEQELAEKMEGAFDDLDLDDEDDSTMCSPGGTGGQLPLKYLTSTPYMGQGVAPDYNTPGGQDYSTPLQYNNSGGRQGQYSPVAYRGEQFQQLQVEETVADHHHQGQQVAGGDLYREGAGEIYRSNAVVQHPDWVNRWVIIVAWCLVA